MALGLLRWRLKGASGGAAGLTLPVPAGAGVVVREVLDPVSQPMGAADVTVTELRSHRVAARGITDPYGFFTAVLPQGSYSLLVVAEGLEPHRETVDVVADIAPSPVRVWLQTARQLELPVPGTWLFDPPHTAIRFIAKHVGMVHVHGCFERFEGGIQVDAPSSNRKVNSLATCWSPTRHAIRRRSAASRRSAWGRGSRPRWSGSWAGTRRSPTSPPRPERRPCSPPTPPRSGTRSS